MPGLTDWFQVFRCGKHTDRFGHEVTISQADIDRCIAEYKPDSAPIVVGHPQLNAPAYGWIAAFRRVGDIVEAKASSVVPAFADAVRQKLYKNRSLAIGPDHRIRHVGFLGAVAPAVKGLPEIQFSDTEDYMDIELSDGEPVAMTAVPDTPGAVADTAQQAVPVSGEQHDQVQNDEEETAETPSENLRTALAEARSEVQTAKEHATQIQQELDALKRSMRVSEFSEYTKGLVHDGRLPQAKQALLTEFMTALDGAGSYEFSEGSEPVLNRFKTLLNDLLPAVDFSEAVTADQAAKPCSPRETANRIREYREELKAKGGSANISQVMQHIGG